MTDLKTPLARARGLGSAKEGVAHWWAQRVTALALIPLGLWFVVAVISQVGSDHDDFVAWLADPLTAILMILTLVATFYHAALGFQVILEDYIHGEFLKIASIMVVKGACFVLAVATIFSVAKIAFGG